MRKYLLHVLIISVVFIAIPITSATGGSITLRSHYRSLSLSQVPPRHFNLNQILSELENIYKFKDLLLMP